MIIEIAIVEINLIIMVIKLTVLELQKWMIFKEIAIQIIKRLRGQHV